MDGIAVSHSTMYVNEIIMTATADTIQSFILQMLHPVSRLVESVAAIFVFVKVRGRRLFSVCKSHMHRFPFNVYASKTYTMKHYLLLLYNA